MCRGSFFQPNTAWSRPTNGWRHTSATFPTRRLPIDQRGEPGWQLVSSSLAGPLEGKVIEVHAGATYLDAVRLELENLGARVTDPLHGLQMGQRLAWYGDIEDGPVAEVDDVDSCVRALRDAVTSVSPGEFIASGRASFDRPGLYSWWVDQSGADDLSRGLGLAVEPGLIYAGLAGATRWPSGMRSKNTLWLRVMTMHLGGNHEFSTFRRTLGAIVAHANDAKQIDEDGLTRWMHEHLRIVTIPYDDRDTLGRLERDVLAELDPPLNLQGMKPTPVRRRLKQLRRAIVTPIHGGGKLMSNRSDCLYPDHVGTPVGWPR